MKTVGLDLSLAATGMVAFDIDNDPDMGRLLGIQTLKPPAKMDGHPFRGQKRIMWLVERVADFVIENKAERVVVEMLNDPTNFETVRELIYFHGAVAYHLFAVCGIEVEWARCSSVRKACGIAQGFPKGTPRDVRKAEIKRRVIEFAQSKGCIPEDDNQADAIVLVYGSMNHGE